MNIDNPICEVNMETRCQIDLCIPLEEVEQFFEIDEGLKIALRQDRNRWQHKGEVQARLIDVFADFDWSADRDLKKLPGIQHYSPALREYKLTGGATPWPLACFALQYKTTMLGFEHNPKVVVGPGALFYRGDEDVQRMAWMLFDGDECKARMYFDREWGSYRRYIIWALVKRYDPPFVQFKNDGSSGRLIFWGESHYPRVLMID